MRWLFFALSCIMQGVGLILLRRSGWFTGSSKTAPPRKYAESTAKARRGAFALFGLGGVLMLIFALCEHHFVLALGQLITSALCLLAGRRPESGAHSGQTSRETGPP